MYPLNDKDLDRLSRDAAEHYDVESSTSGWERLESRLDKELPVKEKDRRRFLFWLFLFGLLTGGGLIYMLGGSPRDNNLQASGNNEAGKVGKVPASEVRAADNKAADQPVASQSQPSSKTAVPAGDGNTDSHEKQHPDNDVVANTPPASAKKDNGALPVRDKVKAAPGKLPKEKVVSLDRARSNDRVVVAGNKKGKQTKDKKSAAPTKDDNSGRIVSINDKQDTDNDVTGSQKSNAEKTNVTVNDTKADSTNMVPAEQASVQKPKTSKYATPLSKWEFGVTTGPDFSNVGFTHSYNTGWNVGVTVGYRIADRWLLNTGLIYTKKFYKVDGNDFYPPKHTLMSYLDVDNVAGSCNMFEIPVNIRYDITANKKGRFFANTGLTSYIMDKQDYVCTYYNNWGQLVKYPWKTDSNYNHILSTVNLSFGYERAIGRNFSLQAEPYFKVPLAGLGFGSIRMNSYGMLLTVKYKPSASKPKK